MLMEVAAVVCRLVAAKVPKVVLISAKPTVVAKDAQIPLVPRVQKEARHSAKPTEEVNVAQPKVARKAYMGGPNSVWLMEVERGVL